MKRQSKRQINSTVRIGPKHQITIAKDIFEALDLKVGDFLNARLEDGTIVLGPQKLSPKDQAWFWTEEWQKGEKEADEDIKAGRLIGPFDSVKEFKKALKKRR